MSQDNYIILGAGVLGLTTALTLSQLHPTSQITILAKNLPGDREAIYASPWAGANWLSVFTSDPGETWERDTFLKLQELSMIGKQCGVKKTPIVGVFDSEIEESGVLNAAGQIWWSTLLPSFRYLSPADLSLKPDLQGRIPKWGFEAESFVLDIQIYLPWLQNQCLIKNISIHRRNISSLTEIFNDFPTASAIFNCTGLGSLALKGVDDTLLYPTRGQVLLVTPSTPPLSKMYFRSPSRTNSETTYIFPRNPGGGIILGGTRIDDTFDGTIDDKCTDEILARCSKLVPELGDVEGLRKRIVSVGVGLRPSRKGGPRVERQIYESVHNGEMKDNLVIHCYGVGGAGYQASWGIAKNAVELLNSGGEYKV